MYCINGYQIFSVKISQDDDLEQWASQFGKPRYAAFNNMAKSVYDVTAENELTVPKAFANTNQYFGCHTDGSIYRKPPQKIVLYCLKKAQFGGKTLICDGRMVLSNLRDEVKDILSKPIYSFGGVKSPILNFKQGELSYIRYNRRSIKIDCKSHDYQKYLDIFDAVIRQNTHKITLEVGQALLIDNYYVLHGRTAFEANSQRWLKRIWLD